MMKQPRFDCHIATSIKVEGSINVVVLLIGESKKSFLHGVFILPIGDSTCPTTYVAVTPLNCDSMHIY